MPVCPTAQHSKVDESVGSVCKVHAEERENDEEITNEESDDTVNGAYRRVVTRVIDPLGSY